jgi:hypothetical protein
MEERGGVRRNVLEKINRLYQAPLTPALSPLVPRGAREKTLCEIVVENARLFVIVLRISKNGNPSTNFIMTSDF